MEVNHKDKQIPDLNKLVVFTKTFRLLMLCFSNLLILYYNGDFCSYLK